MIFIAEQRQVNRNAWLPLATVLLIGKSGEDRHKLTIGGKTINRHNFGNLAHSRFAHQLTVGTEDPVVKRDVIADLGILVIGKPLINHNSTAWNWTKRVGRGHHRVRSNHFPLSKTVDKCREGGFCTAHGQAGFRHMWIEENTSGAKLIVPLTTNRNRADLKIGILDIPAAEERL